MSPRSTRSVRLAASAAVTLLVLAGCSTESESGSGTGSASGSQAAPALVEPPTPTVTAAPGFAPASPPPPAGTFSPSPGSWTGTDPEPGYRVVLLTTEQDHRTRVLAESIRSWAEATEVELDEVDADEPERYIGSIQEAIDEDADLVVSVGDGLIDPLALVTASNLDQPFLVVGGELAEPTLNVTAVDWAGASYRGEGLGQHTTFDAATFTPERADRAIRAGVTAVLTGLNGTVVWID